MPPAKTFDTPWFTIKYRTVARNKPAMYWASCGSFTQENTWYAVVRLRKTIHAITVKIK